MSIQEKKLEIAMGDLEEAQGKLDEKQAELDSAQRDYENAISERQVFLAHSLNFQIFELGVGLYCMAQIKQKD